MVELLDALEIERAVLAGFDWGGRAASVAAALWPDRVRAVLNADGYAIQDIAKAALTPAPVEEEHQYWYQWYFQAERGREGLRQNRTEIARCLWSMWSPEWRFTEEEFARTALSFANDDFVETVIHSYRHRYGNVPGDPDCEHLEAKLAQKPKIEVPFMVVHGKNDRVNPPHTVQGEDAHFSGRYELKLLDGVGHCPFAEAPAETAAALRELLDWI